MGNLTETISKMAARELSEGDFERAIAILKGEDEIDRALRDELCAMLEGFGSNKTRLLIKGENGPIKRSIMRRDMAVFEAVDDRVEATGCTREDAYHHFSETGSGKIEIFKGEKVSLGYDAIKKFYLRMQQAYSENEVATDRNG